jgi:hypothetical protein
MVRKLLWSGLAAGATALAALTSRRIATLVWRTLTGEDPPKPR